MESTFHNCPACTTANRSVLAESSVLVCRNCREIVYAKSVASKPVKSVVPEDWSILQIGTQGGYNENEFTIVGRIRLQLRNDYKNFWCAALRNGTYIWIAESFASVAILGGTWTSYDDTVQHLHAGKSITLKKDIKIKGEYVEKCEAISYEGELGLWKLYEPGFFLIQGSNNNHHTVIFTVNENREIEYLHGGKVDIEKLNLKNTVTWDEWK